MIEHPLGEDWWDKRRQAASDIDPLGFYPERRKWSEAEALAFAMTGELKLSAPNGSAFHRLHQSIHNDTSPTVKQFLDRAATKSQIFVIEHDWAALFANAKDLKEGEVIPPFDCCAFEFRLNGHRFCTFGENAQGAFTLVAIFAEIKSGCWTFFGFSDDLDPIQAKINTFFARQIRALLIMLDAEVAQIETIRAPHKLNRRREKLNRPPLRDYHVVKLNRRRRPSPFEHEPNDSHRSPRLHFRRGHWRHFMTFKTWIKWTLVGDPELGFIDKHYEL